MYLTLRSRIEKALAAGDETDQAAALEAALGWLDSLDDETAANVAPRLADIADTLRKQRGVLARLAEIQGGPLPVVEQLDHVLEALAFADGYVAGWDRMQREADELRAWSAARFPGGMPPEAA